MAYKISGTKNETGRIIVVDETDFSVEKTVLIEGSGDYEVEVTEGKKTILARAASGETLGWGNIDPTEVLGLLFSDPEVFNGGNTISPSVTQLTDTKAIVCYQDYNNNQYGTACILDISGSTITVGNEVVFNNSGGTDYTSVIKLTDTKAIVCYRDNDNNYYGTACVLDISGSTITAGNEFVFNNSGNTYHTSVTSLTDTKAIVCYGDHDNGGKGTACILDVSGSTITAGNAVVFNNSGSTAFTSVTKLTDTKAIVCYRNNGNNGYGTACILDISGSTITAGNEVVFNSGATYYISVTRLTDSKALVGYQDYNNNQYGTACILDISGSTITVGNEVVFNNSGGTDHISVTKLTDTKAIVCYRDIGNNYYGTACVLDISGSTITAGNEFVFNNSGGTDYISVTQLTDTKAIVCYRDNDNNDYGTAKLISNT